MLLVWTIWDVVIDVRVLQLRVDTHRQAYLPLALALALTPSLDLALTPSLDLALALTLALTQPYP